MVPLPMEIRWALFALVAVQSKPHAASRPSPQCGKLPGLRLPVSVSSSFALESVEFLVYSSVCGKESKRGSKCQCCCESKEVCPIGDIRLFRRFGSFVAAAPFAFLGMQFVRHARTRIGDARRGCWHRVACAFDVRGTRKPRVVWRNLRLCRIRFRTMPRYAWDRRCLLRRAAIGFVRAGVFDVYQRNIGASVW